MSGHLFACCSSRVRHTTVAAMSNGQAWVLLVEVGVIALAALASLVRGR